jgi:hypothetical protein
VRNSAFDAKNFFDPADQKIPHFARNQFGGVLSGPIARNRTFFLASYEGLRQRLGITNQAIVPNAAARNGDIPGLAKIAIRFLPIHLTGQFSTCDAEFGRTGAARV